MKIIYYRTNRHPNNVHSGLVGELNSGPVGELIGLVGELNFTFFPCFSLVGELNGPVGELI